MKILQVNKYYFPKGGADIAFLETSELLAQKGHDVSIFSMQDKNNGDSKYSNHFISNVDYKKRGILNVIKSSMRILYSNEAKRKIENLIKEQKPNISHLHSIYHQISPSIINSLKQNKVPIVMTLHDYKIVCASYLMIKNGKVCEACKKSKYYMCFINECVKNSKLKSMLNTIEMYLHHKILHLYDGIDIFISPSQFLIEKIQEMGFKRNIVHLPNFVNTENYFPNYNWSERSIIYFGRLSTEKGLDLLIDSVKNINITLKIIGHGPLKSAIETKIKKENIKNVQLLGFMSGKFLREEIRKSMFVALASIWYENNPRSIIEGFALGKPAVGAKIGGIYELVKDNVTGKTFIPGDVNDLKTKIGYLIDNPDKIVEMGKNAREFVEKELSSEKYYKRLIDIYQKAMDKSLTSY